MKNQKIGLKSGDIMEMKYINLERFINMFSDYDQNLELTIQSYDKQFSLSVWCTYSDESWASLLDFYIEFSFQYNWIILSGDTSNHFSTTVFYNESKAENKIYHFMSELINIQIERVRVNGGNEFNILNVEELTKIKELIEAHQLDLAFQLFKYCVS